MEGKISATTSLRVRYADTDRMGFVYYANYLIYFEVGRTEFIRQLWKPYSELEADGYILPVLNAGVEYLNSARYDDLLTIKTTLKEYTQVKLYFEYEIYRDDLTLIAKGFTKHCFADPNGKPRRMQKEMWEFFESLGKDNK